MSERVIQLEMRFHTNNDQFIRFRDSSKTAGAKRTDQPPVDYKELLQHFEQVQSKHREVRHQRAGHAEHADRKLVLWALAEETRHNDGPLERFLAGPPKIFSPTLGMEDFGVSSFKRLSALSLRDWELECI